MNSIDVILEKIINIQEDIDLLQKNFQVINDHSGETAVELAKLTTRLDTIEKLMWMVIGASVVAVVGAVFSIILHRKNGVK